MKPIQTGIAVALALIVVILFILFPGLSAPFGAPSPDDQALDDSFTINETNQTGMPTDNTNTLQMLDTIIGTGETAQVGDTVTVNYVGSLTNGTVFDASAKRGPEGFTFTLGTGQVIKGWDQGIAGMKVGGKRHLVIPAELAYGSQARGDVIPANATLVFDVELLSVKKATP